ncbi:retrovirus-related pol polyprotein from transposon TNT 1-94 [Tanacetum coccineum]
MVVASSFKPFNFGLRLNVICSKDLVRGLPRLSLKRISLLSCQLELKQGKEEVVESILKERNTSCHRGMTIQDSNGVGIFHQKSVPRTPQQNGVVERRNRTLVEAARTMMIFSKAPMFLWAEVVATAYYTQNRSLIHTRHNKTPYELVHEKKSDLTFFRVFGALCYPTK